MWVRVPLTAVVFFLLENPAEQGSFYIEGKCFMFSYNVRLFERWEIEACLTVLRYRGISNYVKSENLLELPEGDYVVYVNRITKI